MLNNKLTGHDDIQSDLPDSNVAKHEKLTLMTLPAEIHNGTFEVAYIKRGSTGDKRGICLLSLKSGRSVCTTGLRICKQLRLHLKPIIYRANAFQPEQIHLTYRKNKQREVMYSE